VPSPPRSLGIEIPSVDLMCAIDFVKPNERQKQNETKLFTCLIIVYVPVVVFFVAYSSGWATRSNRRRGGHDRPSSHAHTHTHTLSEVSRPPRPLLMIMFAAAYPWLSRVHSISCLCLTRRPCRPQSFLKCFSIFHANYCKQMCACKHTGAEAACYSCYFHGSEYTMINVVDLVG